MVLVLRPQADVLVCVRPMANMVKQDSCDPCRLLQASDELRKTIRQPCFPQDSAKLPCNSLFHR